MAPVRKRKQDNSTKVEVITWALHKLSEDDYHFATEGPDGGWELNLWEWESDEPALAKDEQAVLRKLGKAILDPVFLRSYGDAVGKTPEEVLKEFLSSTLGRYVGQHLRHIRERLGTEPLAGIEATAIQVAPGGVTESVVSSVLSDLASGLEQVIRRSEELRILPAAAPVPDSVQRYIQEASRCYVDGRYLACLLVCRSAVEFGLRDFLKRQGKEAELRALHAEQGDGMAGLITLARSLGKWKLTPTLSDADEVRRKANAAAHETAPDPEMCKDLFIKARGVLRELYS
jgi:hypothetical protein